MGRHRTMTCRICLKTMRSDTLKRHRKQHENKPYSIDDAASVRVAVDVAALESEIVRGANEY